MLVVDGGGSLRTALVGDVIAGLAIAGEWAGLSAKTGAGRAGVPVSFGGGRFDPGAWLCSDEDGIVVSPDPPGAEG